MQLSIEKRAIRHRKDRREKKNKAIQLLGGKCLNCGYSKCKQALVFHHPNSDKDFKFSSNWTRSWDVLLAELNKCVLLCANCHHEEHCNEDL